MSSFEMFIQDQIIFKLILRYRALKRRVPGELILIISLEIVIFKTWILKLRVVKRQKQSFKEDPVFCDVIFCCKTLNLKFVQGNLIYFR